MLPSIPKLNKPLEGFRSHTTFSNITENRSSPTNIKLYFVFSSREEFMKQKDVSLTFYPTINDPCILLIKVRSNRMNVMV